MPSLFRLFFYAHKHGIDLLFIRHPAPSCTERGILVAAAFDCWNEKKGVAESQYIRFDHEMKPHHRKGKLLNK